MNDATATLEAPTADAAPAPATIPMTPPANGEKSVKADALADWLERNSARTLWRTQTEGVTVSCYSVKGTVVITTVFAGRNRAGWELYVPAARTNSVAETLDAAAKVIGNGCAA